MKILLQEEIGATAAEDRIITTIGRRGLLTGSPEPSRSRHKRRSRTERVLQKRLSIRKRSSKETEDVRAAAAEPADRIRIVLIKTEILRAAEIPAHWHRMGRPSEPAAKTRVGVEMKTKERSRLKRP